jgi:hypothetical protein
LTGNFSATIGYNGGALQNGTFSVWVIMTEGNQSNSLTVASTVASATIARGAPNDPDPPGGSITDFATTDLVNKVKGGAKYTLNTGWSLDSGNFTLTLIVATGGATVNSNASQGDAMGGNISFNLPAAPGQYKALPTLQIKSSTRGQLITSGWVSVTVTAQ